MIKSLFDWLDDRTGYKAAMHEALYENIPGGARWRYVWGSTLVFAFFVQAVTGLFLWMAYSPSAQTAWESVFYIQYEMQGGWLLRGLHHYTAQAMIVLMALHFMQIVIDGAYRAPREVNYWLGLALMLIVLGLSLTGYLLPWDQKGYWATRVATKLSGLTPLAGQSVKQLVVGGADYGHLTLTRFFALHAGVLPAALMGLLALHVTLFRKHGICYRKPVTKADAAFWPEQVLKDGVACLAVLTVVLLLIVRPAIRGDFTIDFTQLGAPLGAPADPSEAFNSARPEWYFLFLFEWLKHFGGPYETLGAIYAPGMLLFLLFLMPFIGRWKLGHGFNVVFIVALIFGGIVPLTILAWYNDHRGPNSREYLTAVAEADEAAARAIELASAPEGIPPTGAASLLREDAKVQGKRLFVRNCASCHALDHPPQVASGDKPLGGANLVGFASRKWVAGLLDPKQIVSADYYGATKFVAGDMVGFVTGDMQKWPKQDIEDVTLALSSLAQLHDQREADKADKQRIARGLKLLQDGERCAQCHKVGEIGELGSAPELTDYGSPNWLKAFIGNPSHARFYGDGNDRMPAFAPREGDASENQLSQHDLKLIVDWLRGDWRRPGEKSAAAASSVEASKPAVLP